MDGLYVTVNMPILIGENVTYTKEYESNIL